TFSQAAAAPVQPAARTAPEPVAADREPVARAAQVDRSAGGRVQQASTPSETAAQPPAGVMAQAAPAAIPAPGEERSVTVAPNDTLWQIAAQNRPDNAVSVQQMMLAIQRANEGAFIDGNINGLRTGEVLRIPGIDEVLAVNRAQA